MFRREFLATALLLSAGQALARETGNPQARSGSTPRVGANGGPVSVADGHPIEMVATDTALTFFVQDEDGTPLDTGSTTGRAIVTQGGKNTTIQLAPAAPNKLSGPLAAPLGAGAKVVFSAKIHGHNMQARFEKK